MAGLEVSLQPASLFTPQSRRLAAKRFPAICFPSGFPSCSGVYVFDIYLASMRNRKLSAGTVTGPVYATTTVSFLLDYKITFANPALLPLSTTRKTSTCSPGGTASKCR